jgi:hypothetical protein
VSTYGSKRRTVPHCLGVLGLSRLESPVLSDDRAGLPEQRVAPWQEGLRRNDPRPKNTTAFFVCARAQQLRFWPVPLCEPPASAARFPASGVASMRS